MGFARFRSGFQSLRVVCMLSCAERVSACRTFGSGRTEFLYCDRHGRSSLFRNGAIQRDPLYTNGVVAGIVIFRDCARGGRAGARGGRGV